MAANGDVHVEPDVAVHHTERNRIRRPVFIPHNFFRIEEIDALILGGISAEGKTLTDRLEGIEDSLSKASVENARLRRGVIEKFSRLGTKLRHLALIDDNHALSLVYSDDRAV